ncbi:MAG: MucB/RseB C-terminal domain-containing protein [Pseudomonadota bacterium]|nr:MucB/RseB C-terminal domain-containing protein [Pseudomonadota bacterium]
MSRSALLAVLGLAGSTFCSAVCAAGDAGEMLVRLSEAARNANYEGEIVYQAQNRLETLRVVHGVNDGVEMERIQALTGSPREIVKRDGRVIALLSKDRRVTMDRSTPQSLFPELTPRQIGQLSAIYSFKEFDAARVAGRDCKGLAIAPKDQYRYGYRIWADAQTGVPLKVDLTAPSGAVLERMMFTSVRFPEQIAESAFEISGDPADIARMSPQAPLPQAVAQAKIQADMQQIGRFRQLPPGYRVTMRSIRRTPDGGVIEHVLLSDGLSAISVFNARRPEPATGFTGDSRIGAVHAFGRTVGTVHITVVGEVPQETVRMIGDNVQNAEDAAPAGKDADDGPRAGP